MESGALADGLALALAVDDWCFLGMLPRGASGMHSIERAVRMNHGEAMADG